MNTIAVRLVTAIALTFAAFAGLSLSAPAANASCYRTVTVAGQNAYGYAKAYSWQGWSAYVRTAPTATLCINYARAYGGYYISSVTCGRSAARLTGDSTSVVGGSTRVVAAYHTNAACETSARWKWHRTVANDQCVTISARTRWDLNQYNGTVTAGLHLPSSGYFYPATC